MIHKELAKGRWFEFSLMEQLANVGADVDRAIRWKQKGNAEYSTNAFERAFELLSLTILDPKNKLRLKELTRTREALVDYFMYGNEYNSTDEQWQAYFYSFNYAAARYREKARNGE